MLPMTKTRSLIAVDIIWSQIYCWCHFASVAACIYCVVLIDFGKGRYQWRFYAGAGGEQALPVFGTLVEQI